MLELDREVNFGVVAVANKVISRELCVQNHGSRAGNFKVHYSGHQPLSIVPASGQVPAKTAQVIRVSFT